MLLSTLVTKYRWLITNVPETLHHNRYRWESWLRGLSPHDIANLTINIGGIIHHRHLIEDECDNPETEEFDCLIEIHAPCGAFVASYFLIDRIERRFAGIGSER